MRGFARRLQKLETRCRFGEPERILLRYSNDGGEEYGDSLDDVADDDPNTLIIHIRYVTAPLPDCDGDNES